jgi:hypothetical protein
MKYLAALLLAFVPCIAFADIKLNAPEEAEVGELIRLDASESACEDLIWEVIPNTEEDNKPVLLTHRVYVEPLEPVDPDDTTINLDGLIRQWLTKVRSDGGKAEAIKLAQSFRFIAGSPHTKLEDFLEATATSNRMVLGDSLDAWKPFLDGLGRYLDKNPPKGLKKYQDVWRAIATAIERHVQ